MKFEKGHKVEFTSYWDGEPHWSRGDVMWASPTRVSIRPAPRESWMPVAFYEFPLPTEHVRPWVRSNAPFRLVNKGTYYALESTR